MRFLPWLVIGASVALAVTAEGCGDRACLEWSLAAEGACPSQADARDFFGDCSDVKSVDSGPSYLADMGGLCCYDVTHIQSGKNIPCHETTMTHTMMSTSTSTSFSTSTRVGTGGSTPSSTTTESTSTPTGGGGSSSCQTCSDALVNGNSGGLCSGADSAFSTLLNCGCIENDCTDCNFFCAVGAAPTADCSSCLDTACSAELAACTSD